MASVRFLRPEFIGPKGLFVIASVDLLGDRVEEEPYVAEAVLTVSEPDERGTSPR